MTEGIGHVDRLLFRVDPIPLESPRGYLCRVAQEHNYIGPLSVVRLAGLPEAALERADGIDQISRVLRLEPEEWRAMCYRHVKGRNRHNQRLFCGERVSDDDLNYGSPRLCPACFGTARSGGLSGTSASLQHARSTVVFYLTSALPAGGSWRSSGWPSTSAAAGSTFAISLWSRPIRNW